MKRWIEYFHQKETFFVALCLFCLTVFFVIIALLSPGAYGGADTYQHFFIAHFAFKYPSLFLDQWGKPLFTILSSPFAKFGFFGIQLFNIIAALLSAYFTYRTAKTLLKPLSFAAIFLLLFAPLYYIITFSGLTEILFGLVLILSIYLFFKNKLIWAAIVISFLPFARSEGFIILPFFAMAFFLKRKWLLPLFLFSGVVFFSILSLIFKENFLWFITGNPYVGAKDIYGSGPLLHFVLDYKQIFGIYSTIFIVAGIIIYLIQAFILPKNKRIQNIYEIILIVLPAIAYFAAHSFVWWKGLGGSLGLTRVIAAIMPAAAIIAIHGLSIITGFIKNIYLKSLLILTFLVMVLSQPFEFFPLLFPDGPEEKVLNQAAKWIIKNNNNKQTVYSNNPYLYFKLQYDPYDKKQCGQALPDCSVPEKDVNNGSFVVWDAHFSANEGRLPLKNLMQNANYKLESVFLPVDSFNTLGGQSYAVYIFSKIPYQKNHNNDSILRCLLENYYIKKIIFINTFSDKTVSNDTVNNNAVYRVFSNTEFSPGMNVPADSFEIQEKQMLEAGLDIIPQGTEDRRFEFVFSISDNDQVYWYQAHKIQTGLLKPDTLNYVSFRFYFPKISENKAEFKIYLWNPDKNEVVIDNLKLIEIKIRE